MSRLRALLSGIAATTAGVATLSALSAPAHAVYESADDYPFYSVTTLPAHGISVSHTDCSGAPAADSEPGYAFGTWSPVYASDLLELSPSTGSTRIGVDIADTADLSFLDFGAIRSGAADVLVDLGDRGTLHGTGGFDYYDHRGGEWVLFGSTRLTWTLYDDSHPSGQELGVSSIAGLPSGYSGPANVGLVVSSCNGASDSPLLLADLWLDAGPGYEWRAGFATARTISISSQADRTTLTRTQDLVLTAQVDKLPQGVSGTFELWQTVLYPAGGGVFTTPTWQRTHAIRADANNRVRLSIQPRESSTYQWIFMPDLGQIASVRTTPATAKVTPRVTASVRRLARRGASVTVSGQVDGRDHPRITLYRVKGRSLVKVATSHGHLWGSRPSYSIRFRPRAKGRWHLVVVAGQTRQLESGRSSVMTLKVG